MLSQVIVTGKEQELFYRRVKERCFKKKTWQEARERANHMGQLRATGQENSLSALGSRNSRQCVCVWRGCQQDWPQAAKVLTALVSLGGHDRGTDVISSRTHLTSKTNRTYWCG